MIILNQKALILKLWINVGHPMSNIYPQVVQKGVGIYAEIILKCS